jgi:hypothetical protein
MTGSEPEHVTTTGLKVLFDAIGQRTGQCGWMYSGAAGRCQNTAEYVTTVRQRDPEPVPLCEKHAMEAKIDG